MIQGTTADRVAHPSDRSIAWEETKGSSSSQNQSPTQKREPWTQYPLPSPEPMSSELPLAGTAQETHPWQQASALSIGVHPVAGVSCPSPGLTWEDSATSAASHLPFSFTPHPYFLPG